jgi:hypothetical protein
VRLDSTILFGHVGDVTAAQQCGGELHGRSTALLMALLKQHVQNYAKDAGRRTRLILSIERLLLPSFWVHLRLLLR